MRVLIEGDKKMAVSKISDFLKMVQEWEEQDRPYKMVEKNEVKDFLREIDTERFMALDAGAKAFVFTAALHHGLALNVMAQTINYNPEAADCLAGVLSDNNSVYLRPRLRALRMAQELSDLGKKKVFSHLFGATKIIFERYVISGKIDDYFSKLIAIDYCKEKVKQVLKEFSNEAENNDLPVL